MRSTSFESKGPRAGWLRRTLRPAVVWVALVLISVQLGAVVAEFVLSGYPSVLSDEVIAQSKHLTLKAQGLRLDDIWKLLHRLPESPCGKIRQRRAT